MIGYILNLLKRIGREVFSFLNLGVVALAIAFLAFPEIRFPYKDQAIWGALWATIILAGFALLAKGLDYFALLLRSRANSIMGQSCHCIWRFEKNDGTLENQFIYTLRNISSAPQRTILSDHEGFSVPHDNFKPRYSLISRTKVPAKGSHLQVIGQDDKIVLTKVPDYATGNALYVAEWSVEIQPPLEASEEITISRLSLEEQTEQKAFSGEGTLFAFRCRFPFRKLVMTTIAPAGYLFGEVKVGSDDQAGHKAPQLLLKRSLQKIGNRILIWEIDYPGTDFRYTQQFRLEKQ